MTASRCAFCPAAPAVAPNVEPALAEGTAADANGFDGETPTRNAAGQVTGVGMATVDLTQVKLAEEALRESEQRFRAIADAVHRALVESIGVPADDRFQVVTAHPRGGLVCTPAYLGIRYGDPVLVQLTISSGRSTEQKQRLYARLADALEAAGVARADVVVSLVEVEREDWSFGNGVAQYVPAAQR